MENRIAVIFVEHSYPDIYRKFKLDVGALPLDFIWIRVQNQDDPKDSMDSVEGDNTFREFSGYDVGLDILKLYEIDYDGVLFANDTVDWQTLDKLTYELFDKAIRKDNAIGRIQNKQVKVKYDGKTFYKHIKSNLFFFPKRLVDRYGKMTFYTTTKNLGKLDYYEHYLKNLWHHKSSAKGRLISTVNEDMVLWRLKNLGYKVIPIFPNLRKKIRYYLISQFLKPDFRFHEIPRGKL